MEDGGIRVRESLEQSLKEMNEIRSGKREKSRTWEEFIKELKEDIAEE